MPIARLPMIDAAKGFGIILVVIGHTNLPALAMNLIYAFHVPLFFVLSGMVFNMNKSLLELFVNKFRTLLVPYYFFGIFVTVALFLQGTYFDVSSIFGFIVFGTGYNSALWFIAHLFMLTIYVYLWLLIKNKKIIYAVLLAHLSIGLKLIDIGLPTAWRFDLLPLSFSFFMMGYIFRDIIIGVASSLKGGAVIAIALFFVFSVYFNMNYHEYSADSYARFLDVPLNYMVAVSSGILLTLYFSEKLKNFRFFQFVGKHTIVILSTHQFVPMLLIFSYSVMSISLPSIIHRILSLGLIFLLIVLIDKYARFLIGRK